MLSRRQRSQLSSFSMKTTVSVAMCYNYMQQKDIGEMVEICFRKPKEGEVAKLMNTKMLLSHIQKEYPSVDINHGNKIRVGHVMTTLGYESSDHSNVPFYKVIPLRAA